MTQPIRVGILGAAKIAPAALIEPARSNPEFEITAVAARDRNRAEAFAREHGIANVATDYAALIARDDIDLVYNALPPGMHLEWSIRASEAGKAILCEKPFAMSASEAGAMVEAARRAERPLIEAFHYRHHNVLKRAFALASSGAIGRLSRAEAVFDVPIAYKPDELRWVSPLGGGALMDLGCYCVHALRTAAGEEPHVAQARADIKRGVDAAMEAELRFPDGLAARLHCSMTAKTPNARLLIEGEKGSIEIVNFIAPQIGYRFTVATGGRPEAITAEGPSTYSAQLGHVADVLLRGADPLAGGEDAIANMAAIDGIYAAAGVERPKPGPARPRS